jgi:hypothetical protein
MNSFLLLRGIDNDQVTLRAYKISLFCRVHKSITQKSFFYNDKCSCYFMLYFYNKDSSRLERVLKYAYISLSLVIVICLAVVALVSFHSVSEIHYLKSFYPHSFSVPEAASASIVELVKVALIAFPLFLIITVCLFLIWLLRKTRT